MRCHKSTPPMFFVVLSHNSRSGYINMSLFLRWPSHAAILGRLPLDTRRHQNCLIVLPLVMDTSEGFLTTNLDVTLPCFCSLLSSDMFNLPRAGLLFFIIVLVSRRPFAFNISSTLTEVKYLSEYRCVPLGRDFAIQTTAFPLMPSLWSVNVFQPL